MKKVSVLIGMFFLLALFSGTAAANLLTNGDFETGDLTGWAADSVGDVRIAHTDDSYGFAAAQGMDGYYALLGLEITDGLSRLRQDFDVTGYTTLEVSFNWAFDYWDNSYSADDTFLALVRQDGSTAKRITLLDLQTSGSGFFSPDGGLAYGTYTDTIDISNYVTDDARMVFRLIEESDNKLLTGTASLAGIDNVSVNGAPVPEPATMLLLGTGLVGLAIGSRKKFFKK